MKTKELIQKVSRFHTRILCWLRWRSPIPVGSTVAICATEDLLMKYGLEDMRESMESKKVFYVTNAIRMSRGRWVYLLTDPGGNFYPEEVLIKVPRNPYQTIILQ